MEQTSDTSIKMYEKMLLNADNLDHELKKLHFNNVENRLTAALCKDPDNPKLHRMAFCLKRLKIDIKDSRWYTEFYQTSQKYIEELTHDKSRNNRTGGAAGKLPECSAEEITAGH